MKKISTLSLVMLMTLGAIAQVKFGVKAGVNFANVALNYKDSQFEAKTKLKAGFQLGVIATQELSETLDFSTGLIYSQKGASSDLEDGIPDGASIDGYNRIILNYLEIPLNFELKTGAVRIMAGPYVAFGISGKNKYDYTASFGGSSNSESGESEVKFKNKLSESEFNDDKEYFRALDLGLNIGLGYEINNVLISANYGIGLSNTTPNIDVSGVDFDASDFKTSNRVISIGATYYFGN